MRKSRSSHGASALSERGSVIRGTNGSGGLPAGLDILRLRHHLRAFRGRRDAGGKQYQSISGKSAQRFCSPAMHSDKRAFSRSKSGNASDIIDTVRQAGPGRGPPEQRVCCGVKEWLEWLK